MICSNVPLKVFLFFFVCISAIDQLNYDCYFKKRHYNEI